MRNVMQALDIHDQRKNLHQMAEALTTEGLIDPLELFEMNEMADAAQWYTVEELQNSPGQYRGASTYGLRNSTTGMVHCHA